MSSGELVSVIIPAFNAEATLGATLDSVRRQTHDALEIVVVDDGSTDATAAVAAAAAAADRRITLLRRANAGVAQARNAGVAASRGDFLAPIDADDLWHPEKIARQLAVMRAGGPGMGFVYTPHRRIDEAGRILLSSTVWGVEGHAFLRALLLNFVGNGSALLMRRAAFDSVGGYQPALQAAGAQGCEDFLLQVLIARDWTVGAVPEFLTGYRRVAGAMSEDVERMQRSHLLALEHVRRRHPDTPPDLLAAAEATELVRLAMHRLLKTRRLRLAAATFRDAARRDPRATWQATRKAVAHTVRGGLARRLREFAPGLHAPPQRHDFYAADPRHGDGQPRSHPLQARIDALAPREAAFAHAHPSLERSLAPRRACADAGPAVAAGAAR
jgi:hypothetical protein